MDHLLTLYKIETRDRSNRHKIRVTYQNTIVKIIINNFIEQQALKLEAEISKVLNVEHLAGFIPEGSLVLNTSCEGADPPQPGVLNIES